ncbi:hypothetical protein HHK36_025867 [Tetracentron sinense]|uniref:Uncharacterized protein n=1 Tax=Tetracentron sinense TaxID=13715 RepID=A0A834YHP9_TETSI|nr:hypothetical protein HHK36_025867 [Tetracentron sinense]
MATGAAEGLLRSVFEGCIAAPDTDIERRPYHRNCGCALHKPGGGCSKASPPSRKITYPIRRAWSESCLALTASSSSPSSSPARVERIQLESCNEKESASMERDRNFLQST